MIRLRGPPAPPPRPPTLAHALAAAARHPSGVTFVDLQEREVFVPWAEVRARAERAAANLVHLGVARGDRVAVVLRTEPAFLDAFFGAWLAGAVPVPLYPPVRLGRMDEYVASTARMLQVSGARLVVSGGGTRRLLGEVIERAAPPSAASTRPRSRRCRRGWIGRRRPPTSGWCSSRPARRWSRSRWRSPTPRSRRRWTRSPPGRGRTLAT